MDFLTAMEVSASGLSAERARINVASSNLANVQTTRTDGGGPYQRQNLVLSSRAVTEPGAVEGSFAVAVDSVQPDPTPPRLEYDPGHPDAGPDGYVAFPNVNVVEEMVDMITASRAYQAGLTALNTAVSLAERALGIGR
jgi:flagellar basal-body rod protein FlgC